MLVCVCVCSQASEYSSTHCDDNPEWMIAHWHNYILYDLCCVIRIMKIAFAEWIWSTWYWSFPVENILPIYDWWEKGKRQSVWLESHLFVRRGFIAIGQSNGQLVIYFFFFSDRGFFSITLWDLLLLLQQFYFSPFICPLFEWTYTRTAIYQLLDILYSAHSFSLSLSISIYIFISHSQLRNALWSIVVFCYVLSEVLYSYFRLFPQNHWNKSSTVPQ